MKPSDDDQDQRVPCSSIKAMMLRPFEIELWKELERAARSMLKEFEILSNAARTYPSSKYHFSSNPDSTLKQLADVVAQLDALRGGNSETE